MPPPLSDGLVTYPDGVPATADNYARDVAAFLMWTAEPKLEERKRMGLKVLIYLAVLAGAALSVEARPVAQCRTLDQPSDRAHRRSRPRRDAALAVTKSEKALRSTGLFYCARR